MLNRTKTHLWTEHVYGQSTFMDRARLWTKHVSWTEHVYGQNTFMDSEIEGLIHNEFTTTNLNHNTCIPDLSLESFLLDVAGELDIPFEERKHYVGLWQDKLGLCKTIKTLRILISRSSNWTKIDLDECAKAIISQKLESNFKQGI